MSNVSSPTQRSCSQCGASNAWDSRDCWVCHAPLPAELGSDVGLGKAPPSTVGVRPTALLVPALLVIAVVATMLGLWKEAPGLAVLLAVVFVPGVLLTLASSDLRKRQGRPMTTGAKIVRFLFSVAMTIGVLVVLAVVAFVAFVVWLFIACADGNFH